MLSGNTDAFFHGPLVLHECVGLQLLGRQGRRHTESLAAENFDATLFAFDAKLFSNSSSLF